MTFFSSRHLTNNTYQMVTPDPGSPAGASAETDATDVAEWIDDFVVLSNREPYQHRYADEGGTEIVVDEPVGGLTAGLDPVLQRTGGTWVAWGDAEADPVVTDEDGCVGVPPDDEHYQLKRVWLTDREIDGYYYGYSNQVLWPLCHDLPGSVSMKEGFWDRYRTVNRKFADAVVERATAESTVWIQDYHFGVAPRLIRPELSEEATLMQFWHIPWPSWQTWDVCPQHEEILRGLLANDLLGFHVERFKSNFLKSADECLDDATVDREAGEIHYDGRTTVIGAHPMGVNADQIAETAAIAGDDFWSSFREEHGISDGTRVAAGVDRLDYTKGIPQRVEAFELLLERHPEWRGELTLVQKSTESRTGIPAYREIQSDVVEAIEQVNDRFGTADWTPVVHITDRIPQRELVGLYRHADLALVSPLRDGLNLVSKEFVAAQVDEEGVLLLSEFAGAHEELGEHAVTINPHDPEAFAEQIERALTMDRSERRERMRALREQVIEHDLDAWLAEMLSATERVGGKS